MIYNQTASAMPNGVQVNRLTVGWFWRGSADRPDLLDPDTIDWTHALDRVAELRGTPLVINIEGGPWEKPGQYPDVLDRWCDLMRTVRRVHGGEVGIYRMLPEAGYWQPIRALHNDDPEREHYYWRLRNNRLYRLADEVDVVYPALYPQPGDHYRKPGHWHAVIEANIREAQQYGKPVRPFTTPQWRGRFYEPLMPLDEWREHLEHIRDYVGDIVIYMDNSQEITAEYLAPAAELFGGPA